jgi:hypothetical protein
MYSAPEAGLKNKNLMLKVQFAIPFVNKIE